MSDERKPVICPWCGWEMVAREGQDIFHGKYNAYVCEGCEAVSPIAYSEDAAYAAATATPPNRPLTREQVESMPDLAAVWNVSIKRVERGGDGIGVQTARVVKRYLDKQWVWEDEIMFAAPPTPADIAAARAGKGEGNAD